jgi:hypothetical protein
MILLLLSIVYSFNRWQCIANYLHITCAILFNKLLRSVEDVFPKFEMLHKRYLPQVPSLP